MSVKAYPRKLDVKNGRVELSHGSGGRAMAQLISDLFHQAFGNEWLARCNDQSAFDVSAGRMVMTTDGYVVTPLFFPGGNIGSLAVHGTINDVAMSGARPLYLSASFIIEEGFRFSDLKTIADSMGAAARGACVYIIAGDTKVVERGKADRSVHLRGRDRVCGRWAGSVRRQGKGRGSCAGVRKPRRPWGGDHVKTSERRFSNRNRLGLSSVA